MFMSGQHAASVGNIIQLYNRLYTSYTTYYMKHLKIYGKNMNIYIYNYILIIINIKYQYLYQINNDSRAHDWNS